VLALVVEVERSQLNDVRIDHGVDIHNLLPKNCWNLGLGEIEIENDGGTFGFSSALFIDTEEDRGVSRAVPSL
jgi:hypothetical protein